MSSTACLPDVIITKEYRRFAEFCDACRRYGYIGLCYGTPGVGKTLSARHYAKWDQIEALPSRKKASDAELAALMDCHTVLYTPNVVNSPRQVEEAIRMRRNSLQAIPLEILYREEEALRAHARLQDAASEQEFFFRALDAFHDPQFKKPERPESKVYEVANTYYKKREEMPEHTTLLLIDEADRLKAASLEQVRDIFDRGGMGVVLIGMPGLEKRLSRYPQLYSRVGFVHEFRPLSAAEMRDLLCQKWAPPGVILPEEGFNDEEVLAAIIRITGGNFRLLHRLMTQVARLVEINALSRITRAVVEAARESLVIGAV